MFRSRGYQDLSGQPLKNFFYVCLPIAKHFTHFSSTKSGWKIPRKKSLVKKYKKNTLI